MRKPISEGKKKILEGPWPICVVRVALHFIPAAKKNIYRLVQKGAKCPLCGKGSKTGIIIEAQAKVDERTIFYIGQSHQAMVLEYIDKSILANLEIELQKLRNRGANIKSIEWQNLMYTICGIGNYNKVQDDDPLIPVGHEIKMIIYYIVAHKPQKDGVVFEVWDLGPARFKGTSRRLGTKRDLVNIPAIILDGLQRTIYPDDKMVSVMEIRKIYSQDIFKAIENIERKPALSESSIFKEES